MLHYPASTDRIDQFLSHVAPPTPCVVIDLEIVRQRYRELASLLPDAHIHYAVKANPSAAVIAALAAEGASCDVASPGEIARCLAVGMTPERCCFGHTIKRECDIASAFAQGIELFAFDAPAELEKIARAAPGSRVFCRLMEDSDGADWPLTRKFGCTPALAAAMLLRARELGLRPFGVSFHVGSQQTHPAAWSRAIADAAQVFAHCALDGLDLTLVNLGGGLPAHYRTHVPPLHDYIETIDDALARHFGNARPSLMIEPGRYLVADAGILRAEVLLITRRGGADDRRWVYLDAGRYNGLAETQGESIHYPIRTRHDGGLTEAVVLAGPTCDSTDMLYEKTDVELPLDLAIGDTVDFMSAGAYTASYASVEFNGFPPIATHCV